MGDSCEIAVVMAHLVIAGTLVGLCVCVVCVVRTVKQTKAKAAAVAIARNTRSGPRLLCVRS